MKMRKGAIALTAIVAIAFLAIALTTTMGAPGRGTGITYVPEEILLKFRSDASIDDRVHIRAALGATPLRTFASSAEQWRLGPGVSVEEAIERLQASTLVAYAEPNYVIELDVIPDDPRLPELWGMINDGQTGGTPDADIDADLAWGVSTGSPTVVVGVIDTGIDYNHPDLAANIFINPNEIPGNAIDDDGNGFVDDVRGWDFVNNDNDPFDDNGHGTHCSGTITGIGNNGIGVAGVAWNVKVVPLKFLSGGGSGSTADAVLAVDYATALGVDLTSNSWGGGGYSQTLYDAIARANAADIAFVAAAGNNGTNNDTNPHYPSNYDLPNVISVAATDHNDAKASFSNYGAVTVDLGAPGVNILSTMPGNSYGQLSGTSMATPHVAGTMALIRSVSPNIPVAQAKQVLLNSTDQIASMQGIVSSNGRLNAFFAIAEPDDVPPGQIDDLAAADPGSNTMGLTWTATGDDGAVGTATDYDVRYSIAPIDETNWDAATRATGAPDPLEAGQAQAMEVAGLDADTMYYFAIKAKDEWGNSGPISNVAQAMTLPPPTGAVDPTSVEDDLFTGEQSDHIVTLSNDGVGTLDWVVPPPYVGEPNVGLQESLELGKDDLDPRENSPITEASGGPDTFGYRWVDSDDPGGPTFAWQDISQTGTPVSLTGDDATSGPIDIGFNFPYYGTFFDTLRICTNGWLSFTSTSTAYGNQPLPTTGAPENMIAPFWDDLNPKSVSRTYFQNFGSYAIVQWQGIERYSGDGAYTFQVILDASGVITLQYLTLTGTVQEATVGMQDASKTDGLQIAFNQAYLHDELAVRIAATPQWLTASPTSGRLRAGESIPITVHMDASGLDGGTYPGAVNIQTNDPINPVLVVDATLRVTGAPDARVQPESLAYGDVFLGEPYTQELIVANDGTDVLHVTDVLGSSPELVATPSVFDVPPKSSQVVTVTWTSSVLGPFEGSVTVVSNDAAEPEIVVPVTGNAVPAPVMIVDPPSFNETLYSGQNVTRVMTVTNTGGSDLIVDAAADLGDGVLLTAPGEGIDGAGGPDDFGYRWKDSDEPGGPAYDFVDISTTGTQITFSSSDDSLSAAIDMGMTFPFYGANFSSLKVSTNGWLTFDTTDTLNRLSNSNLPSTSGAKNMVALFWDDLHLRTGNVKYQLDGNRFIVQYTNVEKYSPSGNPLTFQVQLYSNGKVVLVYRTMGGTLNSATIGVQDGTRTIGLPVNYNANYVHSEMAVQISRTPDWLQVTPANAVVPPGESFDFDVTFDAMGRNGGVLEGAVVLLTNIPTQAEERVPARLTVIGAPIVDIIPASYDYGPRFTGFSHLTTFQVVNNGTDVLNVSEVYSDDPTLLVEDPVGGENQGQAAFPLPPGGSRLFNLRWVPTVPMTLDTLVHVISDDPATPDKTMPVTGVAAPPPVAAWSPGSFTETLNVGDVVHRPLRLENNGGSDLVFGAAVALNSGATVPVYESLELKKDELDPREGVLGIGGPDVYGYRWRDSDQEGGPAFDWFDIRDIGTPVAGLDGDDESSSPIAIGFDFPFYGTTFSEVRVKTNGFVSFTDTATSLTNNPLPSSGSPANLLAVFWDDLHFRGVERARTYNDGEKFIIQFTEVDRYSAATPSKLTYQVLLYPSGRIVYQYLTMDSAELASSTVGIQNATKTDGLTVAFNTAYLHDNLAVQFEPPVLWPSVTPSSGVVPPGGFIDLDVTIDARGLNGGEYHSVIELETNDPANALIDVPVDVTVIGAPNVEAQPTSLLFPTTFVGLSSSQPLTITNSGTDDLTITGLEVAGEYAINHVTLPVTLDVGGSLNLTVTFFPLDEGLRLGSLTVASDDPVDPMLVVPFQGDALIPPEIHVTPEEIRTALPPGGNRHKTLTIRNAGGSDLNWNGGTSIISAEAVVEPGTFIELEKEESDPREGTLGSGGPDFYGHRWVDSDEPGGPPVDFFDISTVGTQITLSGDDSTAQNLPIGFEFPFYGNAFTTVNVCTNGWLSFTSTRTSYSNQPLPNTGTTVPENMIAAFWDDLHFRTTGKAYTYFDGRRFIVQWTDVERLASGSLLTFQVILYQNGNIELQYGRMTGTLDSATIGIQNQAKDDGLTVAFNTAYMHSDLAVRFSRLPDWVVIDPTEGTVPEEQFQEVDVFLDAVGLEDGIHEASIQIQSNDPYAPIVNVPVRLNLSLIEPTLTEFNPKVLRLGDTDILRVRMKIELPPELDPHAIRLSSVMLNDSVPALESPAPYYTDDNLNGIEEVTFWFDAEVLKSTLGEGTEIPVTIMGEVEDVQWWRGMDTVRTGDPDQYRPVGGEYILAGNTMSIAWNPASTTLQHYTLELTRDGGQSWETLVTGLESNSYDWTVSGALTENALIRITSYDQQGNLLGADVTDSAFTIAGGTLLRPRPINGSELVVGFDGVTVELLWKAPSADLEHGPADRFRVLRGTNPQMLGEIGVPMEERWTEEGSATAGEAMIYWTIIAANAAGDAGL